MASPILIPKKSTIANKVPMPSQLADGEVSVNWADQVWHGKHPSTNAVVPIGAPAIHSHDELYSINGTQHLELQNNGDLTLPNGGTISDSATAEGSLTLTPPNAGAGQGLVVRPTVSTWSITSSGNIVYGSPITISVGQLSNGNYFGTVNYSITGSGVTQASLGRALTGSVVFSGTGPETETITWTIPANSDITEFTLTITGIDGERSTDILTKNDPALYYNFEYNGLPTNQFVTVTNNGTSNSEHSHVHLISADPSTVDIYLGDDDQYVKIERNAGGIVIGNNSNTKQWNFKTDGVLELPAGGDITLGGTSVLGGGVAPATSTYYGTTAPDPLQYKAWMRTDIGRLLHRYDDTWVEFSQTTIYYTGSTGSNTGNLSDITNGLVFHLDSANTASYSGTGTTWNDISGSGYTATLVNGVALSSGNMTFDGADDYVSTNFDQSLGDFTVMIWFKPLNGNPDWARIVDKDYLTGFWIGKNGNTTDWGGGVVNGTTYRPEQTAFSGIVNNTWNFMAFARSGPLLTNYYNGSSNPVVVSCSSASTSTTPIRIGANALTSGERFKGQIPIVRIYNRALSTIEVGQLFDGTKSRFGL